MFISDAQHMGIIGPIKVELIVYILFVADQSIKVTPPAKKKKDPWIYGYSLHIYEIKPFAG